MREENDRGLGRPRDRSVDGKILQAAIQLVTKNGFRGVSLELIAENSGVARTTIYRRWRNRSALIADAFLATVETAIDFDSKYRPRERLVAQMAKLAALFRSEEGTMLRALLGEAQFDEELRSALATRWIAPRRAAAIAVIVEGIASGALDSKLDPEALVDALYGGLYYWLIINPQHLTDSYVASLASVVFMDSTRT